MTSAEGAHHLLALLLQTGLAPAGAAAAAWRNVERKFDIERLDSQEHDALCLAGSRLGELGAAHAEAERIAGLVRHAWVSSQLALDAARTGASQPPLLTGRLATVAAYLPAGGRLPVSTVPPTGTWDGPIATVDLGGHTFRVPSPAGQLVDAAIRRQWTEVGCLLTFGADTSEVAAEAARRGRRAAVRDAVELVAGMLGPETVPPERRPSLRPSLLDEAWERLRRARYK